MDSETDIFPGLSIPAENPVVGIPMTSTGFRARQFLCTLSPAERAAVARRSRFYSLPWLRPAGHDNTDEIP